MEVAAIFQAAFRALKPRTPLPDVNVEFRPYANINSTIRLRNGQLRVRLSDLLKHAPPAVVEALAFILLCKLYRLEIPNRYNACYRRYINRQDVRRLAELFRQHRGRKQVGTPRGRIYDLEKIFQELNARYFHGLLGMPILTWSRTRSRTMLGHFDPIHNTIVISRLFDSGSVPRCVLEYLLYHEMLHLKYPIRYRGGRRTIHSAEFQQEERRFDNFEQARAALKAFSHTPGELAI